jgi:hypothetical protein
VHVVREGRLIAPLPDLGSIREHCRLQREQLPDALRRLDATQVYPVTYSDDLEAEARRLGVK